MIDLFVCYLCWLVEFVVAQLHAIAQQVAAGVFALGAGIAQALGDAIGTFLIRAGLVILALLLGGIVLVVWWRRMGRSQGGEDATALAPQGTHG